MPSCCPRFFSRRRRQQQHAVATSAGISGRGGSGSSLWSCCCCCRRAGGRVGALDRSIVLLLLGLDNAGKTCTAKSLVGDKDMAAVAPTVGFSRVETK